MELQTLSRVLRDLAEEALIVFVSRSGEASGMAPEYILPAYAFLNLGSELSATLETNSGTLWNYYSDQQAGLSGAPKSSRSADYDNVFGSRRFDLVVYDRISDPVNGRLLALVEYKLHEFSVGDLEKIKQCLKYFPTLPGGILVGRLWGDSARDNAEALVRSYGLEWIEPKMLELPPKLAEERPSWIYAVPIPNSAI
jgi:hypothetical protein